MSRIGTTLEQLRDRPDQELREALVQYRDELFRLELGKHTNQVTSTALLRSKRRDIARILTILNGRKHGIETQATKKATEKPAETRMGTGKGGVEGWVAVVKPGRVIFEVEGVPLEVAKEAFERAHHKLTVKTHLISREPVL